MRIERITVRVLIGKTHTEKIVDNRVFESLKEAVETLGAEKALQYINYAETLTQRANARMTILRPIR